MAYVLSVLIVLAPALARADVAPGPVEGNLWLVVSLVFTWGGIELYRWLVKRGRHKVMAIAIVVVVIAAGDVGAYFLYRAAHARPHRHLPIGR